MPTVYSWTLEHIVDGAIESSAFSKKLKPFTKVIDDVSGNDNGQDDLALGVHVLRGNGKDKEGYWGYAERRDDGRLHLPVNAESFTGATVQIPVRFHVELALIQDKIYGRPERND